MQAWENIAWDSLHSNSSVWKLFQKRIHLNQDSSSCSTCQTYVIHESEFKWSLSNASPWKALIWIQAPKEKKGTMQPSDLNQDSSHCGIRFQARFCSFCVCLDSRSAGQWPQASCSLPLLVLPAAKGGTCSMSSNSIHVTHKLTQV